MRIETDEFKQDNDYNDSDLISASIELNGSSVSVSFELVEAGIASLVELNKQQAAEFARQILEICGEGENES